MNTVVAELTPKGRGAVATIGVRGAQAVEAVSQWFHPARAVALAEVPINRIVFGEVACAAAPPGEELVVCRTAHNSLEVHCHGGAAAVAAIVGALQQSGSQRIAWSQWLALSEPDRLRVAAQAALSKASTARLAALLLDQYRGALRRELTTILTHLAQAEYKAATRKLNGLMLVSKFGLLAVRPFRVLLAGAPNVGKSSLINRLLGYERSIVFDEPGTTRDVVTAATALAGWPVELRDLAGLRTSDNELEAAGVVKAMEELYDADLLLWVRDATQSEDIAGPSGRLNELADPLIVWNKSDLVDLHDPGVIAVSAKTGAGFDELQNAMVARLGANSPVPGQAVPFTRAHLSAIMQAFVALQQGQYHQASEHLESLL